MGQLGNQFLHEPGHDNGRLADLRRKPVLLLADDRHLVFERARIVRPDLRAKAVLERGDDPAAGRVVLRVRGRHHVQVQGQTHDEAADLNVAFLEDVEQAHLDPLGQVRQFVDRHDPPVGPRDQAVVERQDVGQVAALGHLDRIHFADQVRDRDVRGRQFLGVAAVTREPRDGRFITQLRDDGARGRTDRCERVVVQFSAFDHRQPRVQQLDQHSRHPRLRLPALPEKDEIVPGQDRVLDRRHDRVLEADDPRQERAALGHSCEQIASELLLDRARVPAVGAKPAERANPRDRFGGRIGDVIHGALRMRGRAGSPSLPAAPRSVNPRGGIP